jgi:hypothetical protein
MRKMTLMAVLAGCTNGGGGGNLATPDAYESAVVTALCQHYARCGAISASQVANCESLSAAQIMSSNQAYSPDQALAAGRISYDGTGAAACVDSFSSAGCDIKSLDTLGESGVCVGFVRGLVATGGSCKGSGECQNGYCDQGVGSISGCPGTCKAFAATGGDCSAAQCAATDYCSSNVCTRYGAAGAPCSDLIPCASTLVCQAGTCQKPGGAGAACSMTFISDTCAAGLFCDRTSLTCKARLSAGSTCNSNSECNDGLLCAGTCRAVADIGGSCANAVCAGDAVCDPASQKCMLKGVLGADCGMSFCQIGLYCNAAQKCAQRVAFGGKCDVSESGQCLVGECVNGTCALMCM